MNLNPDKIDLHEDISPACRSCGALSASVKGAGRDAELSVECDVERTLAAAHGRDPLGNIADGATEALQLSIQNIRGQMTRAGCAVVNDVDSRMQYTCNPLATAASKIQMYEARIEEKREQRGERILKA